MPKGTARQLRVMRAVADGFVDDVLEVHRVKLATQELRVAFDPITSTLYLGEDPDFRGHVVALAQRAAFDRNAERAFVAPLLEAENEADYQRRTAQQLRECEADLAARVFDATARLKSRKKGVRRRARRALEGLGRP